MGRGTGKILAMLLWSMMMPITCAWAQHDDSGIWGEAVINFVAAETSPVHG
jgi:hypothetical protein